MRKTSNTWLHTSATFTLATQAVTHHFGMSWQELGPDTFWHFDLCTHKDNSCLWKKLDFSAENRLRLFLFQRQPVCVVVPCHSGNRWICYQHNQSSRIVKEGKDKSPTKQDMTKNPTIADVTALMVYIAPVCLTQSNRSWMYPDVTITVTQFCRTRKHSKFHGVKLDWDIPLDIIHFRRISLVLAELWWKVMRNW